MAIKGIVKKGEYFDSVSLMIAAHKINQMEGVIDSAVVMGTRENKAILKSSGFLMDEFQKSEDTDLLIAVKAETEDIANAVLTTIDKELKHIRKKEGTSEKFAPRSFEGAVESMPDANLSLISVPGKYAADEAVKALKKGLHVMLFSDNVPIEKEIELKKYAQEKGLLVMGPDCGTAIINGRERDREKVCSQHLLPKIPKFPKISKGEFIWPALKNAKNFSGTQSLTNYSQSIIL